jgi:hypothetical protein
MKDEPKPQGHNSSYPEDDRLVKELESSDKTIGSVDPFEVESDIDEDPLIYYKILRIHRESSLQDIHNAFAKMNDAWHPNRYPHVISWEEKSKKKLKEIRNAYEKLLRLHSRGDSYSQVDPPSAPLVASTAAKPEHPDRERPLPGFTTSTSSASTSDSSSYTAAAIPSTSSTPSRLPEKLLFRIMGIAAPSLIILILAFLWPSLYHYEAISLGGKEYPLRINRITTHATYYNGNQWIVPPFHIELRQEKAVKATPVQRTPPVAPVEPVQPLQSAQASPPVQPIEPAKPAQSFKNTQPSQPTLPDGSSGDKSAIPNKPSSLPQPKIMDRLAKKEVSPKEVAVKIIVAKPYSIQITAYPEKDKADALAKRLRGEKIPVRVEEVAIKGKGRWHRVLLGTFKDRNEALKYFDDHKIGKIYPQSFIQKSANY